MINSSEMKNKKSAEISHVSRSEALDVKSRHLNWRDICYGTICLKSQFKLNYRIIDASVHSMCIQYTVYSADVSESLVSRPVATKQAHGTKSPRWLESKRDIQKSMLFFLPHCLVLSRNDEFYVPNKYLVHGAHGRSTWMISNMIYQVSF